MKHWSIVVVDDSSRFPLHVWRYASGCLGFGIGEVGADGRRSEPSRAGEPWIIPGAGTPLVTDDARHRLFWVAADDDWQARLDDVFNRHGADGGVLALVDIHGKPGSGYSAEDACEHLEVKGNNGVEVISWLVSAYHSGHRTAAAGKTRAVLPKSRDTLRRMIRVLGIGSPGTIHLGSARHILVTGAGFEICDARGGFGEPSTRELLQGMEEPFCFGASSGAGPAEDRIVLEPAHPATGAVRPGAFPVPRTGVWRRGNALNELLNGLANEQDLDSYWDLLLEEECGQLFSSVRWHSMAQVGGRGLKRDRQKARAVWHERRLRQAFRRSLLEHDWGFMNQSLDAARLPLHAWLTTNYTQFANRAISLYCDTERGRLDPWRIVATAAEARTLAREDVDLEPDEADQQAPPPEEVDLAGKARYLFKLHGDIAHLQTMAIAGHDKDIFSPLSMPIEDLYEVYAAAERFLLNSLRGADQGLVVWHIVGHGLLDKRLCILLRRVARQLAARQVFAVINPDPGGVRERLVKALGEGPYAIHTCKLTASQYMARLHRLLCDESRANEVLAKVERFAEWLCASQAGYETKPAAASLY